MLGACPEAVRHLAIYDSLEDVWENIDNPSWSAWLVAKLLGKKMTFQIVKFAMLLYLKAAHRGLAKKCARLTLPQINREFEKYPQNGWEDNLQFHLNSLVEYGHEDGGYLANSANRVIDHVVAKPYDEHKKIAARSKSVMAYIRYVLPKKTFLRVARKHIQGVNIAEAVIWTRELDDEEDVFDMTKEDEDVPT